MFAAGFTLFAGGVGSVFDAEGADTVVMLGWGGVACVLVPGDHSGRGHDRG